MARTSGKNVGGAAAGKPSKAPSAKAPEPGRDVSLHAPEPGREIIDMAEAIAILKTTQPTFHRWLRAGKIRGMKVGRQWRFYRDEIERFLKGDAPLLVLPADIAPLIGTLEKRLEETGWKHAVSGEADDVQRAVGLMMAVGAALGASDLHVTTHVGIGGEGRGAETSSVIRCRIDGVLHELARFDTRLLPLVVERWKSMSACDVRERSMPQDGRVITEIAAPGPAGKRRIDMRVSFVPTALGESMTVRILDAAGGNLDFDSLDLAQRDRERLLAALRAPHGAIILTGPTGSGKTTTIYSCLNRIAGPELKIITIEDPVEYILPWATQIPVNAAAGLTFERAIRSMLRSDPDVLFIGEIRNFDTLNLVVQASLTGHLVISTLHTNDADGALKRMVDIGAQPFMISGAVRLVVAQRLVRKLCPKCASPAQPSREDLDWAASAARRGGLEWDSLPKAFRKAVGCPECGRTGYRGRTIVVETLAVTPEIGAALEKGASLDELRAIAVGQGMTTMSADGIRRAARGETSIDEVRRVCG